VFSRALAKVFIVKPREEEIERNITAEDLEKLVKVDIQEGTVHLILLSAFVLVLAWCIFCGGVSGLFYGT